VGSADTVNDSIKIANAWKNIKKKKKENINNEITM
jgi:hypothetical protein